MRSCTVRWFSAALPIRRGARSWARCGSGLTPSESSPAIFETSRPAISKHLRLLRLAGLMIAHQRGTASVCQFNARPLRAVNDWLGDYRAFWQGTLRDLKTHIEEER